MCQIDITGNMKNSTHVQPARVVENISLNVEDCVKVFWTEDNTIDEGNVVRHNWRTVHTPVITMMVIGSSSKWVSNNMKFSIWSIPTIACPMMVKMTSLWKRIISKSLQFVGFPVNAILLWRWIKISLDSNSLNHHKRRTYHNLHFTMPILTRKSKNGACV